MVPGQEEKAPTNDGATGGVRRVIAFRPRPRPMSADAERGIGAGPGSPVSDLARFEQDQGPDDYRHRMIVNAVALAFTVVLVVAGIWIAGSMALMRKNQDCVLMGRKSCGEVVVPPPDRWSGAVNPPQR